MRFGIQSAAGYRTVSWVTCSWRRAVLVLGVSLSLTAAARRADAEPTSLSPQEAYAYGENETPRAAGMGGALRAIGSSTSGMFLNPAAMVETRVYHIEALAQVSPEARRQVYSGAVVDSVTGRLAGGISVTGGFVDPDGVDRSYLDARVGVAYPISDRFFVGLTGKYAKIFQEGMLREGGLGASPVSGGLADPEGGRLPLVDEITFDAGVAVKVSDSVYIGALGQNLTFPGHGLLPSTAGGGIGIATSDFSVEGDVVADFHSYPETAMRLMIGGEYLAGDHFPLRLGYRWDQGASTHAMSAGAGYVGKEFAVEAALRRTLADPGATTIFLGITYHLEATGLTKAPSDF
jgi:hypothetical protein